MMASLPVQVIPNVTVLGPPDSMQQRLAIFSFVVHTPWAKEQLLHHSFVCAVLNDVYGIQVSMGLFHSAFPVWFDNGFL
jgi:hypothetical protein